MSHSILTENSQIYSSLLRFFFKVFVKRKVNHAYFVCDFRHPHIVDLAIHAAATFRRLNEDLMNVSNQTTRRRFA